MRFELGMFEGASGGGGGASGGGGGEALIAGEGGGEAYPAFAAGGTAVVGSIMGAGGATVRLAATSVLLRRTFAGGGAPRAALVYCPRWPGSTGRGTLMSISEVCAEVGASPRSTPETNTSR